MGDGIHFECRWCGEEPWDSSDANAWNSSVAETVAETVAEKHLVNASLCMFSAPPRAPYAWDPRCQDPLADIPGCGADGIHRECRYCGVDGLDPCPNATTSTTGDG